MAPRTTRPQNLDTLLPPILSNLTSTPPNPYSAHQKALTTTARLVASGQYEIAIEILAATARELLKLGEGGSGTELAVRMVAVMTEGKVQVDDKSRASVTQLLALTPPKGPWRKKFADAAIKWSVGECPTGDPALHQYIGEMYYKDRSFVLAETHLLSSGKRDAANTLAEMMFEWCEKGTLDPAPYAVRGTLPFLSQTPPNILPAQTFLSHFSHLLSTKQPTIIAAQLTSPNPSKDINLTTSHTLNFLQLAILTVQRAPPVGTSGVQARGMDGGIGREWEGLVNRYRKLQVLNSPEIQEVIQQISTNTFLIPPPRSAQGGDMLQNLMGSLFGGGGGMGALGR